MKKLLFLLPLIAAPLGAQTCDSTFAAFVRTNLDTTRIERARIAQILQPAHAGRDSASIARADSAVADRCKNAPPAPPPVDTTTPPVDTTTPPAPPPPAVSGFATLPQDSVDVSWRPVTGRTLVVNAGDNLQAALDSAQRGDEVVLQAGATFSGHFILKPKPGSGWILVRTSEMSQLPPLGVRLDTVANAPHLAKIESPLFGGAIATQAGASGWRFVGLEITSAPSVPQQGGLVLLGDGSSAQNSLAQVPFDLILDRVWVHGTATLQFQRCVALNSARTAVVNSVLSDCHMKGFDSQAIGGWNGPGPFLIENNYLEGAGENLMFGGANPAIQGLNPTDITIRRNHFFKPVSWKGKWTIKNLLEIKQGIRVLIEYNVFDGSWTDGQTGVALLFKTVNQGQMVNGVNKPGPTTWAEARDITVRYNVIRNAGACMSISALPQGPGVPMSRLSIVHNLCEQIGSFNGTVNGRMLFLSQDLVDVEIGHNTLIHNTVTGVGSFMNLDEQGRPGARNVVVQDNISTMGGQWFPVVSQNAPTGSQALATFAPGADTLFKGNVIELKNSLLLSKYPSSSSYLSNLLAQIGFLTQEYVLSPTSPFKGKATDGSDPGADVTALRAIEARAVAGR